MWPWRRKPAQDSAAARLPVTRGEWRALPPIQRTVGQHPLVNPVQRFSASLASWRDPSYLDQLGHRFGGTEPAGVIDGIATPVAAEPAMPVARPPRRKGGLLSPFWSGTAQRSAESPVPAPPASPAPSAG